MILKTPEKIRNLQRNLYCKAKAEPAFRCYLRQTRSAAKKFCATLMRWPARMRARRVWTELASPSSKRRGELLAQGGLLAKRYQLQLYGE